MKFNLKTLALVGLPLLCCLALGSAVLVSYLSNTAEVEMNVESPMSVAFSDGGSWETSLSLGDTTGLSTVNLYANIVNLANNEIEAPDFVVELDNGKDNATCDDLTSILFTDSWCHGHETEAGETPCPEQELAGAGLCDDSTGKAVYTIPTMKYKVGQDTTYPVTITFANVEPSVYTIEGFMNIHA